MPAEEDPRLIPIIEAIADGSPVDWAEVRDSDDPTSTDPLRVIAEIAAVYRQLMATDSDQSLGDLLSAAPAESDRSKGVPWGPLLILDEVGGGSFGKVYRAWDPSLDHEVALKRLRLPAHASESEATSIVREGQLLARVRHQNVITVHGACEINGEVGIWMEFVRGKTLEQIVRSEGPMSADEASVVGESLCRGLAAVHQAGLLHRDIKASNVMREAGGRIVVLDLGTSTEIDIESQPGTRRLAGTPVYMAPELFEGSSASVQSDIYSVGVLLFYLTTGTYPAEGKSLVDIRTVHQAGRRRLLSDLRPDLPGNFVKVIERALSPLPEDRCQSAGAMLRSLSTWTSDDARSRLPADNRAAAQWRSWAGPTSRRVRLAAMTTAAIAVAAIVAVLLAAGPWREPVAPSDSPVVAVMPFSTFSQEASAPALSAGLADVLIGSLGVLPGVVTISRPSTLSYADTKDFSGAAKALGATILVVGSLQKEATSLRVTISLVKPGQTAALYSKTFDGSTTRIFRLQADISEAIADQFVKLRLIDETALTGVRPQLAVAPTSSVAAFEEYSQGRTFLERLDVPGGLDRAIGLFERAIARDSQFALAHAALGESLWAKYGVSHDPTLPERARTTMLEALRLAPNEPRVRYALAVMYRSTGRFDEAIDELQRSFSLGGASDDAHRLLGRILDDRGRTEEAIAEFRKAIELRPGFWDGYRALGLLYYRTGDYIRAAEAFHRITELQPDNAWGFQTLGTVYQAQGRNAIALSNYQRANALAPSATSYSNIGTLSYSQGRFQDAVEAYERSLKLRPNEPAVFRNLGDALTRLGKRDRAAAAYGKAIEFAKARVEVNPKDARSIALRGLCEAKLGRLAEGRRLAQQARSIDPQDGDVAYQQAVIDALGGTNDEALRALQEAIRLGYSPAMARGDDDLIGLRAMPAFNAIVAGK